MAGTMSLIVVLPFDLVKVRAQANEKGVINYKHEIGKLIQAEGAKGLFRGFSPCFWRDVPSFGAYFWINEFIQTFLKEFDYFKLFENCSQKPDWLTLIEKLHAGGITGTIIWVTTYPFDLLKTEF